MQTFKTDKKIFWISELKSWFWTFVFATFLYFGFKLFLSLTTDIIYVGVIVIFLTKLADTLTQYHLVEIQIDGQNNQLLFVLNSIMSGEKIKRYELGQATSELINNSGLTKYLSSPFTLNIFLRPKDNFKITNRYGFSLATLASVDKAINLKDRNSAIQ
jgi:hypothetical protein